MRFILSVLIITATIWGQAIPSTAVESYRSSLVTFTSYNKTRFFIRTPDSGTTWRMYVDTSSTGQAREWKRVDNTSDSLSNAVLVAGDSTSKNWSGDDWLVLVTTSPSATNTDSAALQLRAYRQFVVPIRKTSGGVRTALSRPSKNASGPNRNIRDTVAFDAAGGTAKALRIGRISPEGAFIRLRPSQVSGTGKTASDTVFGDSIWLLF